MDIKRPGKSKLKKRIRTVLLIVVGLVAVGGITYGLSKLKPAAPTLDRGTAVIETVKRGEMVREVHGNGTLVPQVTRQIPAPADGRVEKIMVQAGVEVGTGTVIVELSNPQMEQQAMDAEFQVKTAEAEAENLKVRLESEGMTQQSQIASINAEYSQAKLQLDTDEVLAKQGLVADLILKVSRVKRAGHREPSQGRAATAGDNREIGKSTGERATIPGVAVAGAVQTEKGPGGRAEGSGGHQRSAAGSLQCWKVSKLLRGSTSTRIADPASLKAELKIPETQIKDVRLGQTRKS